MQAVGGVDVQVSMVPNVLHSPKIAQGELVESARQVSASSIVASGPERGMARRLGSPTLSFHHDALLATRLSLAVQLALPLAHSFHNPP